MSSRCLSAVALATLACAGDGTGLDEYGNPLGQLKPLDATLESIQQHVFGPICTQCHTGAAAPLGLALDAAVAGQNLISVPSAEVPSLLRVDPGQPDSSYLVWKIEGRAGIVGGRMPLGLPQLADEQIGVLRQWIANGAPSN